jgi:hypothetical protein
MKTFVRIALLCLTALQMQAQHYVNPSYRVNYTFHGSEDSLANFLDLNWEDPVSGRLHSASLIYDAELSSWNYLMKAELIQGAEGYDSCSITHIWNNQNDDWELEGKYFWTVDGQGRSIREFYLEWNPDIQEWEERWKLERTFNQDGTLAGFHRYMRTNPSIGLVDYDSASFFYDSNGNDTLEYHLRWNETGENIEFHEKIERSYDAEDRIILEVSDRLDPLGQEWVHKEKIDFHYETIPDSASIKVAVRRLWEEGQGKWLFHLAVKLLETMKVDGKWMELGYDNYLWEIAPENWNPGYKLELVSDLQEHIILESTSYWDPGTEEYLLSKKQYQSWEALVAFDADTICHGDSVLWNGNNLRARGVYLDAEPSFAWPVNLQGFYLAVNPNPVSFDLMGDTIIHENETSEYVAPDYSEGIYHWEVENGSILSYPAKHTAEIQWGDQVRGYFPRGGGPGRLLHRYC